MRLIASFVAIAALATAQAKADGIDGHPGQIVRTTTGVKLGPIDRVNTDGSVRIIYGESFVTLPADTIKSGDGSITTSLTRKDVDRLRN